MDLITYGLLNKSKANLDSPAFTGTPTAPTPATTDNTTKLATTEFVRSFVATLKGFYLGVTTTALVDEVTTSPNVVINGETVTAQDGNWVIADGGEEFVYSGTVWQKFGDSNWISVIGNTYNSALTYNTGDYVIYMDGLYKCKEDNVTGEWDASKWNSTTITDEILTNKVTANLNSAATDTLKNIKIGNTIYETTVTKLLSDSEYNSLTPAQKNNGTIYLVDTSGPKLVPWSTGTDQEITEMISGYYTGKLSLADIKSVWSLGDVRNVDLSAMSATGVGESHRAQTVQVEILDFDHDTLTTPVGSITKALITCDLKSGLMDAECAAGTKYGQYNTERGYINVNNTNTGGWRACIRRAWCNNTFYNALPSYFKALVKPVNKLTSTGGTSSTINTDSDYCFLLSEIEIFGSVSKSKAGEGSQYAWFANATANRYKLPKYNSSSVSDSWWERSPLDNNSNNFCYVNNYGYANATGASYSSSSIAPAFCL